MKLMKPWIFFCNKQIVGLTAPSRTFVVNILMVQQRPKFVTTDRYLFNTLPPLLLNMLGERFVPNRQLYDDRPASLPLSS